MNAENERKFSDDELKQTIDRYFPGIWSHWAEICARDSMLDTETIPEGMSEADVKELSRQYGSLGPSHDDDFVIPTLCFLCDDFLFGRSVNSTFTFEELVDYFAREDMLKLYVACSDFERFSGRMTLKSRDRAVTIDNTCNWMQDFMIRSFLKEHLYDISSVEDAERELSERKIPSSGRKCYDPHAPIIMKGLYTILTETHEFATPMPNRLCSFIIFFLDLCGIRASERDIDNAWVRSQLRYYLADEKKTDQSSMMNGAQ